MKLQKIKNVLLVTTQGFIKRGTRVDVLEHFLFFPFAISSELQKHFPLLKLILHCEVVRIA